MRNFRSLAVREGFSTITMQVVRSAFLPHLAQERSLRRKLIEIELAGRLERALPKQRILELYLNVIYLGNGTYGVEAASRDLFGKSVGGLTVGEAALLAGLARGPSIYSPAPASRPGAGPPRRGAGRRWRARDISSAGRSQRAAQRAAQARGRGLEAAPRSARRRSMPVRAVVDSILGDDVEIVGDVVVHTTLDAGAQRAAERAVSDRAAAIERGGGAATVARGTSCRARWWRWTRGPGRSAPSIGGRRYVQRGFNRALGARRQPGSAFKPFVYAAALSDGYTPASLVDDSPVEVTDGVAGLAAGQLRRRVRRPGHLAPRAHGARPTPPPCG